MVVVCLVLAEMKDWLVSLLGNGFYLSKHWPYNVELYLLLGSICLIFMNEDLLDECILMF